MGESSDFSDFSLSGLSAARAFAASTMAATSAANDARRTSVFPSEAMVDHLAMLAARLARFLLVRLALRLIGARALLALRRARRGSRRRLRHGPGRQHEGRERHQQDCDGTHGFAPARLTCLQYTET